MRVEEYNALLSSVAEAVSAPDFFPLNQPENDLHPDPRALRDEIVTLRHRITDLERRFNEFQRVASASAGEATNVSQFPNR